ncbi:MAG: efflux RND transporter permease subunit [Calditrichaeota bacterium]|nr:efflux RND transporter permease subunit [Calditrichota bacterium]
MPLPLDVQRTPFYFSIKRPVTATMVVLTVIVFGILSLRLLPINMMPPISYPSVTVRTEFPGSAPEEVEEIVTRPLEQSLGIVSNLVNITSSSRAGVSDITLEFDWDTDMNRATQDVREKIDLVYLPDDVQPPLILRYDPNLDPLMRLALISDSIDQRELRRLGEDVVKRELEKLTGVAAVKIKGGEEVEVRVALDAHKLELMRIPLELVQSRLAAENINIAGGRLLDGSAEYILRTQNEFISPDEIGSIIIFSKDNNIRLSDIAAVGLSSKEETIYTQAQGKPSVELEIFRESEANPITISTAVQKRLFGLSAGKKDPPKAQPKGGAKGQPSSRRFGPPPIAEMLPASAHIITGADQSEFIKLAIGEVQSAAIIGGLLAILVLWVFLRKWIDIFIVALVIPVSLVCAFAAMNLWDITLNMMSLGGLALGVGMMVDNAIVVVESIYRRRAIGEEPEVAAVRGTRIVGSAVTSSTLTTLVVFFPIVFVTGIAGQIFSDLALTIVISLSMSLIVALFFVPMLAARWTVKVSSEEAVGELTPPQATLRTVIARLSRGWRSILGNKSHLRWLIFLPLAMFSIIRFITGILLVSVVWIGWWALEIIIAISRITLAKFNRLPAKRLKMGAWSLRAINKSTEAYGSLLALWMKRPVIVVFLAVGLMGISYGVFAPRLGSILVPSFSQGLFDIRLTLPIGTPLQRTVEVARLIELEVRRQPGIRTTSLRAGEDIAAGSDVQSGSHTAVVTVRLASGKYLEAREAAVVEKVREKAENIPGLEILIAHPTLFTFKQPLEIILRDDDLNILKKRNESILSILNQAPYLADIESTVKPGHPEINIRFDRDKLALLGLSAGETAQRVKTMVHGAIPTKLREADKRIDIRVNIEGFSTLSTSDTPASNDTTFSSSSFNPAVKADYDRLKRLVINPNQTIPVALEDIAVLTVQEGPAEIRHVGSVRSAVVTADVKGIDIKRATENIALQLSELNLTPGIDWTIGGQKEEMESSLASLKLALGLAIFLVYVVMASQFESFGMPFLVLLTIPVSLAGVIPVLFLFNIPLSVMVFLGLIVLVGIVVNNSIVLVDYINQLRKDEKFDSLDSAIINAAKTRLRPILMTTLTTILGLLPMALGLGEGAEMRKPMAITVMVGLAFSLLVSLVFIPTLYRATARKKER